jgi:ubiquitin C-terminal hydrolase
MNSVLAYVNKLHENADWRTKNFSDWLITVKSKSKSSTGFVGLKNLGCICYMNSCL